MWIQKSSIEVKSEERLRLLRSTITDLLLGLALWYILVHVAIIVGLPSGESASWIVALGVALLILPSSWLSARRTQQERSRTLVCTRCNNVKSFDNQIACKCGGRYLSLTEMKWVTNPGQAPTLPLKTNANLLHAA